MYIAGVEPPRRRHVDDAPPTLEITIAIAATHTTHSSTVGLGAREDGDGDRGVGARDDQRDVREVHAAQHASGARRPRSAVVHRRGPEHEARRRGEDGDCEPVRVRRPLGREDEARRRVRAASRPRCSHPRRRGFGGATAARHDGNLESRSARRWTRTRGQLVHRLTIVKAAPLAMFPLAAVVFPSTELPLHVFEHRYQCLTRDVSDRLAGVRHLPHLAGLRGRRRRRARLDRDQGPHRARRAPRRRPMDPRDPRRRADPRPRVARRRPLPEGDRRADAREEPATSPDEAVMSALGARQGAASAAVRVRRRPHEPCVDLRLEDAHGVGARGCSVR